MSVYIAYRDLVNYRFQMSLCGGTPVNPDFRLATVKSGAYLLTCSNKDYAVTQERAEQFKNEVLSKATGSHDGHFPMVEELNGKTTAAVIEINEDNKTTWYDFDDGLILKMLTELKDELGEPLDRRGLINHCYPNPALPDDFELQTIYHQIYCGPDNIPQAVVRTMFPDTVTSRFWTFGDEHFVVIREGNSENKYRVPDSLIPGIKEKVRELCKDPAEAYVEPGNWESYIQFGKTKERIFTNPDKTLELLNNIASGSEFDSTSQIDTNKYYPFNAQPANAFGTMGIMGMMSMAQQQAASTNANQTKEKPASPAPGTWNCKACGKQGNTAQFCPECGAKKPEGWKCPMCGATNTGKFCMECGSVGPDF